MNPNLDLSFWARLSGILALEIIAVVALAFLAQALTQSAFWRRTIWQSCLVCLLLLVTSETTGLGRGVAVWFAGKRPIERKVSVRILPPDEQFIPSPIEYEDLPNVAFSEEEAPVIRSIWWPGILWLVGIALIVARIVFARFLFLTLRWRKAAITDAPLLKRVAELAQCLGVRRKIHLLESRGFSSPMTFGIAQSNIGLPTGFAHNFSAAEQNAMLTHELAHVAARDPFWYLLADLTTALLWWHPLVWLARRRLHSASELAADEAAAILENGPGTLAACLVNLGQRMTQSRSFGWLGMGGNGFRSHLGQRVERLLNLKESKPSKLNGLPLFFAKTVGTILFGTLVILTSGWIQNGKAVREKNFSTAVQKSWNGSVASVAISAYSEQRAMLLAKQVALAKSDFEGANEKRKEESTVEPKAAATKELQRLQPNFETLQIGSNYFALPRISIDKVLGGLDFGISPKNSEESLLDEWTGLPTVRATEPNLEILRAKMEVAALVQEGKVLFEAGMLEEAEAKFNEALKLDPKNVGAFYYKSLVADAKYARRAQTWPKTELIRPTFPPRIMGDSIIRAAPLTGPLGNLQQSQRGFGLQAMREKAGRIFLPEISFQGTSLTEVLKSLQKESKIRDPDHVGFKFIFQPNPAFASNPTNGLNPHDPNNIKINIHPALKDIRLSDALDAIVQVSDKPIRYDILDNAVIFSPLNTNAVGLYTRVFKVNSDTFLQALKQRFPSEAWDVDADAGAFSIPRYTDPQMGTAIVVRTNNEQSSINRSIRNLFQKAGVDFGVPEKPNGKAVFFNERTGTLMVRATEQDLEMVGSVINTFNFNAPSKKPEETALPRIFKVNPETFLERLGGASAQNIASKIKDFFSAAGVELSTEAKPNGKSFYYKDRFGWLLVHAPPDDLEKIEKALAPFLQEPAEINKTKTPEKKELPSRTVDRKKLSNETDAQGDTNSNSGKPPNELQTRVYKVNPNVFIENLEKFAQRAGLTNSAIGTTTNLASETNLRVRSFFTAAGVKFGPIGSTNAKAKAIFFDTRKGSLMVRATLDDLEIISTAIEVLNYFPPQIMIETKFVEISEAAMKKLRLDWLVANAILPLTNQTASHFLLTGTNVLGKMIATNSAESMPTVGAIFTDPQFRTLFRALEQTDGVDILAAPKLTTLSGRQAQISVLDLHTVVLGSNPVVGASGAFTNGYQTEDIHSGSVLDVLPTVAADGFAIQLTLTGNVIEFLGYYDSEGRKTMKPTPGFKEPRVRVRKILGEASVWDGQTVMLSYKSREKSASEQKTLFMFVTPMMIDPAGNRVNSFEDTPFTENSVPKQPEQK